MSERNLQSNIVFGAVGVQPTVPISPPTRTHALHRETAAQNSRFMDTRGAWHEAASPFEGHPRHRPPRALNEAPPPAPPDTQLFGHNRYKIAAQRKAEAARPGSKLEEMSSSTFADDRTRAVAAKCAAENRVMAAKHRADRNRPWDAPRSGSVNQRESSLGNAPRPNTSPSSDANSQPRVHRKAKSVPVDTRVVDQMKSSISSPFDEPAGGDTSPVGVQPTSPTSGKRNHVTTGLAGSTACVFPEHVDEVSSPVQPRARFRTGKSDLQSDGQSRSKEDVATFVRETCSRHLESTGQPRRTRSDLSPSTSPKEGLWPARPKTAWR